MELMAAFLAQHSMDILVCYSGDAAPAHKSISWYDAITLPAGEGDFTCCAMKHRWNGKEIPCDKVRVRRVMETMLENKMTHAKHGGDIRLQMMISVLRPGLLKGLMDMDDPEVLQGMRSIHGHYSCLASLRTELGWSDIPVSCCISNRKIDKFVVAIAAATGSDEVIRTLVQERADVNRSTNLHLKVPWQHCTPLMCAMAFGKPTTVKLLLDARANPMANVTRGAFNGFVVACWLGRLDNVNLWLEEVGNLHANQTYQHGVTALHVACLFPRPAPIIRALLKQSAAVNARTYSGLTPLNFLVFLTRDSDIESVRLLVQSKSDVNSVVHSPRCMPCVWMGCARALYAGGRGYRHGPLRRIANCEGATLIHGAAMNGDVALVKALIELGALQFPNKAGLLPMQVCRCNFGIVPEAMRAALEGIPEAQNEACSTIQQATEPNSDMAEDICDTALTKELAVGEVGPILSIYSENVISDSQRLLIGSSSTIDTTQLTSDVAPGGSCSFLSCFAIGDTPSVNGHSGQDKTIVWL